MRSLILPLLFLGTLPCRAADDQASTQLAAAGKALLPVVIAKDAPPRVRQAAQTLADYLGRISGAPFSVIEGDGRSGLAVGRVVDFPGLGKKLPRDTQD